MYKFRNMKSSYILAHFQWDSLLSHTGGNSFKIEANLTTATATCVLMPSSQLAGFNNFCFNSLSSQVLSFQILLLHSSHNFLDWPLFLFPVISSSIISRNWELSSCKTWPYHHRRLWIIISTIFTTIPTLSWRTSIDTLSTTLSHHVSQ